MLHRKYVLAVSLSLLSVVLFLQCAQPTYSESNLSKMDSVAMAPSPADDSSLFNFTTTIVSQRDMKYVGSMDDGYWSGWSDDFVIANHRVKRNSLLTYDSMDTERLLEIPYDLNQGKIYDFKGRRYAFIWANYHMCNGTGCMECFYFVYDYSRKKLHCFSVFGAPEYAAFGDIDHDERPDVLVASCSGHVYDDSTKLITFEPYRMNEKGRYEKMKCEKDDCYIVGRFDNGIFAPMKFAVIEKNWFE